MRTMFLAPVQGAMPCWHSYRWFSFTRNAGSLHHRLISLAPPGRGAGPETKESAQTLPRCDLGRSRSLQVLRIDQKPTDESGSELHWQNAWAGHPRSFDIHSDEKPTDAFGLWKLSTRQVRFHTRSASKLIIPSSTGLKSALTLPT